MLNIVVPMAGRGSRFVNAGYRTPKPLIEVYGHPMIEYVTKNITPACEHIWRNMPWRRRWSGSLPDARW